MAASVLIRAHTGPAYHCGSGTIFASDGNFSYVLTCKHVVEGARTFDITLPDGRHFAAGLLAVDAHADLACLYVAARNLPTIPLAQKQPPAGTSLWQVGYPGGQGPPPVKRFGRLTGPGGTVDHPDGHRFQNWKLHMKCEKGDSGSGFFTASKELTLVLWGGAKFGQPETSAVGLEDCWRFVETQCKIIGLIRGRRPAAPPKGPPIAPPMPPSMPPIPDVPPPVPDAPRIDLEDILRQIAEIRDALRGKAGPEAIDDIGRKIEDKIRAIEADVGKAKGELPELLKPIRKEIEDARGAGLAAGDKASRLSEALDRLRGVVGNLKDDALPVIVDKLKGLTDAGSSFPWLAILTALGSGTGGAGLALIAGRWLLGRGVERVKKRREAGAVGSGTAQPTIIRVPAPQQYDPAVIVTQVPAAPQVVRTNEHYTMFEGPNKEAEALRWAAKKILDDNPALSNAFQYQEQLAKAKLSGEPVPEK